MNINPSVFINFRILVFEYLHAAFGPINHKNVLSFLYNISIKLVQMGIYVQVTTTFQRAVYSRKLVRLVDIFISGFRTLAWPNVVPPKQ